jgi:hypothetical protein
MLRSFTDKTYLAGKTKKYYPAHLGAGHIEARPSAQNIKKEKQPITSLNVSEVIFYIY